MTKDDAQGRWHVEHDSNQAQHEAIDQERRDAEAEAQRSMTDATYEHP